MTAWNAAWCIERALDTVFAQTRPPDEVLLSDDGSTDDTVARVEARYRTRVRILRLPHQGLTLSRKAALEAATGDWLSLMDADDWWKPTKLERQADWIVAHPEVKWISTDGDYVQEEGLIRASWLSDYFHPVRDLNGDLFPYLIERCFPLVSSMMIEAAAYRASGGFDPAVPYSQDYDLWMRLAAKHPGAVIGTPLITYWSSPGQLSRRYEARHRDDLMLLERVARGELRRDAAIQARAAEKAAGLAFDLALIALRAGRTAEARGFFGRATGAGPWRRRGIALAGRTLPAGAIAALARSGALRDAVGGARPGARRVDERAAGGTS